MPDETGAMSRAARRTILVILAVVVLASVVLGGLLVYRAATGVPIPEFAAGERPATTAIVVRHCRSAALVFPPGPPPGTPAAAALDRLPTAGPDLRVEYTQDIREREYGGWRDVDCDGQDTRAETLARQTVNGLVVDPYTGASLPAARVQIDHVVSVGDSWRTGAQNLTRDQRRAFANDPRNTRAVLSRENGSKSDKAADAYLPPLNPCAYAADQIEVKAAYGLWVEPGERRALRDVLATCPGRKLP